MKSQAMKTTSTQDSAYQTPCALSAQKNSRKKSGLFETTNARKLQTSFPPIHFSLSTPSRSMYKSCKDHASNLDVSRDIRGQKINLPQVEKPLEKISAPIPSFTAVDKSKVTTDHSRYLRACSNTLVVPFHSTREMKLENKSRLDLPSSKVASEGLSAETHKVPECPNCKKERRIQNEYDKFILQSKRDKEALQKTIVELETELKRYEEHNKPAEVQESEITCSVEERRQLRGEVSLLDGLGGVCKNELAYMRNRSDLKKLEEESKGKQQQMDSLLVEMEELKAQLQRIQDNEETQAQMTKMKQSKLVLEMEELKSQLEKTKERERQKVSVLENEKDACLREIAEMKTWIEKMSTENRSLWEKMKALETRSSCCLASVVHGNAEIQTISHHSTCGVDAGSPHCFNSCGGTTCNSEIQSGKCVAGTSSVEDNEIGMKEMYKQLKREHKLLLDVMLLMYTRGWFLEEAIPYVRRTLRKCGVNSEYRN